MPVKLGRRRRWTAEAIAGQTSLYLVCARSDASLFGGTCHQGAAVSFDAHRLLLPDPLNHRTAFGVHRGSALQEAARLKGKFHIQFHSCRGLCRTWFLVPRIFSLESSPAAIGL